jgi:hypothetical protein
MLCKPLAVHQDGATQAGDPDTAGCGAESEQVRVIGLLSKNVDGTAPRDVVKYSYPSATSLLNAGDRIRLAIGRRS